MTTGVQSKKLQNKEQEKLVEKLPSDGMVHHRVPKITVVIPTLNEEKNLPYVLPGISEMVDEVLLVDGYSTDNTIEMARSLCPNIRVVMQDGKGKGAALRTGFAAATGDIIVMIDADGSTAPSEIPAYIGALMSGADFAKGSRFLQGGGTADMSLIRKLGNGAFVVMVRVLFGGHYSDLCYGYNAFWKRTLPVLDLNCDGFEIETMMNIRALKRGLKVAEVPSYEYRRVFGEGRLRAIPDGWRVLKTIFKEFVLHMGQNMRAPQAETGVLIPQTGKSPLDSAVPVMENAEEQ